jgi:DNA-binding transcriptional MocR family regulator
MMDGVISFIAGKPNGDLVANRHRAAAAAMHRYMPHVVAWRCPSAGAPISVTLPENLSVRDLVHRATWERVELAPAEDPAAPDRSFEIHYLHLAEADIEEGIRRLGYCLAHYSELAARLAPGQPGSIVGV